ncbi:hypothetical protein D3C74_314570 [compost metagenome]
MAFHRLYARCWRACSGYGNRAAMVYDPANISVCDEFIPCRYGYLGGVAGIRCAAGRADHSGDGNRHADAACNERYHDHLSARKARRCNGHFWARRHVRPGNWPNYIRINH